MNHVLHTFVLVIFSLIQESKHAVICFIKRKRALTGIRMSALGSLTKITLLEGTEYTWNITAIFIGWKN